MKQVFSLEIKPSLNFSSHSVKLTIVLLLISYLSIAQEHKRVLFIGNSYTGVNNLPQLTAQVAISAGDTLTYDSNTPGGQTFQGHFGNAQTLSKIQQGDLDFVVLQEQSQLPSFPIGQVQNQVFPYAKKLDSLINVYNLCAESIFYMTWGRKNGDAGNCNALPDLCTYEGMDSLLRLRYTMMAESNNAILSPVGVVWRYLREYHPEIELYQSDESHPSLAGSYAAACSFYATIFRKNPLLITDNSGLSTSVAQTIRAAAKTVVFDSLSQWFITNYDPVASFSYTVTDGNHISFSNDSDNSEHYFWDFGDGSTSTEENPSHVYNETGTYEVRLISEKCGYTDTTFSNLLIDFLGIESKTEAAEFFIYPNPAQAYFTIQTNQELQVMLYDIYGKSILSTEIKPEEKRVIQVEQLPKGIYLVKADNANYSTVRTIIVE
jgi:hypothetical protein